MAASSSGSGLQAAGYTPFLPIQPPLITVDDPSPQDNADSSPDTRPKSRTPTQRIPVNEIEPNLRDHDELQSNSAQLHETILTIDEDRKSTKKFENIDIPKFNADGKTTESDVATFYLHILKYNKPSYLSYCGKQPNMTAIHLAKSGLAVGEKVVFCPNCEISMDYPKPGVDMLAAHYLLSPGCDLANSLYSLTTSTLASSSRLNDESSEVLVIKSTADTSRIMTGDSAVGDGERMKQQYEQLTKRIEACEIEEVKRHDQAVKNPFSMMDERARRSTFTELDCPDCPRVRLLAYRGLYLQSSKNQVQIGCVFCNLNQIFRREMITSPVAASSLDKDHLKKNCGYLSGSRDTGNIPDVWNEIGYKYGKISDASELLSAPDSLNRMEEHAELGINAHLSKHPVMAVADRRAASFLTYPYRSAKHPEVLSQAGYFYSGDGDSVTCYSCGTVSSKWTTQCDVWVRHARTSPHCSHVLSVKGQNFVDRALAEFGHLIPTPSEDRISVVATPKVMVDGVWGEHGRLVTNTEEERLSNVTARMMRPRMDSIPVQKALNMGIPREYIRAKGEADVQFLADIVREVTALTGASDTFENTAQTIPDLPKVVRQPHKPDTMAEESPSPTKDQTGVAETNGRCSVCSKAIVNCPLCRNCQSQLLPVMPDRNGLSHHSSL